MSTDAADVNAAHHRVRVPEPTTVLAPLLALVTILAISVPGAVPIAAPLCVVGWTALSVVWIVELVQKVRSRRAGRPDHRSFWMFLVLPVFFFMVLFAAVAEIPVRARFSLSEAELTAAAQVVLDAGGVASDGRIGSLPIQSVETDGLSVWFVTNGFGTPNRWGFLYAPSGLRNLGPAVAVTDLGGDWYEFREGDAGVLPLF